MYHSARRLRQFVRKITVKDGLLGMKFAFPTLMAGISIAQLGLDEAELAAQKPTASELTPSKASTSTGPYDDEGNMLVEIDRPEMLLTDEDLKIEWIRMDKEDKNKSKNSHSSAATAAAASKSSTRSPFPDSVIPREIITSWISGVGTSGGSGKRATAISNPRLTRPAEAVLPRRDASQGLTSLAIVNPDNAAVHVDPNGEALFRPPTMRGAGGDNAAMNSAISMKQTLSRLAPSSGSGPVTATVACFKEDRRNLIKPVKIVFEHFFHIFKSEEQFHYLA